MKYWTEYKGHDFIVSGERKQYDSTIYTFDIETTSYIILDNKIFKASDYMEFTKEEQERCIFQSVMYIWQLGINDTVYYGRTWQELDAFLNEIEEHTKIKKSRKSSTLKKYIFVHNLSYEFVFLQNEFDLKNVFSRKSRKVMKCELEKYKFELRCTYYMSNSSLDRLAKNYNLNVKKLVGNLDYDKIRTPVTPLTKEELAYCENDCLVVYEYIKKELETYKTIRNLPLTSTGHVRKELKEEVAGNFIYKNKVKKSINIDPHVYNLLLNAFQGGYTHASWIYASETLKNVTSWDFTSSYPYCLCTCRYPATEFKKCYLTNFKAMGKNTAYLLRVKFYKIKSNFYNNIISLSKCKMIKGSKVDNGRIIYADELEIVLTDVDIRLINKAYSFVKYDIIESYYSFYDYLPRPFIQFVLKKYVNKTKLKNVDGMEVEYMLEKNKFNALYGMAVTNNINDKVIFENRVGWREEELTNEEIENALFKDKKKGFLSFSYGVWCTAWARYNLLTCLLKLDKSVVYSDTDSLKLLEGYDESVITDYNKQVIQKIKKVCKDLSLNEEDFSPTDIYGEKHTLGLWDFDGFYEEFKTLGAKKYAYITKMNIEKARKKGIYNILRTKNDTAWCLGITVSGVPKNGAKALNNLQEFKENLVFPYKYTNKNILMYNDNQIPVKLTDYKKNTYVSREKIGACIVPAVYTLGMAEEYSSLVKDESSPRARYKE